MGDFEMDLEELETILYNQVYHSNAETNVNETILSDANEKVHTRRHNTRYFQIKTSVEKLPKNQPHTLQSAIKTQPSTLFNEYMNKVVDVLEISVNNPCSVIPKNSEQTSLNNDYAATKFNKNLGRYIERQTRRQQKKQRKMEYYKQKRKEKRKLLKEQKAIENAIKKDNEKNDCDFTVHYLSSNETSLLSLEENTVVTISDSDDSCIEIPEKRELVILSSDDENSENSVGKKVEVKTEKIDNSESKYIDENNECSKTFTEDDDILYIDSPQTVEIIDIDCDSKSIENTNKVNSVQTDISSSTNSVLKMPNKSKNSLIASAKKSSKERNELLRTPDSASNDFLDVTIDLQQKKFNFSLHGTDFGNSHNFVKPKSYDVEETASSCTSDNSTPVKNTVFSEIEFDTANKELFGETSLVTFGKYITPTRETKTDNLSSQKEFETIITKSSTSTTEPTFNISDSSSESDYDGHECLNYVRKQLPDLTSVDSHSANDNISELTNTNENSNKRKSVTEPNILSKKKIKDNTTMESSTSDNTHKNKNEETNTVSQNVEKQTNKEIQQTTNVIYIRDDDIHVSPENTQCKPKEGFSKYWTTDMHKFHNTSWGLENFSVIEAQKAMSGNGDNWKILDLDRNSYRFSKSRMARCRRCRERGHAVFYCRNPPKPPRCTLCGQGGHLEPRCPNRLCTLCGSPGGFGAYCRYCVNWRYVQCSICQMYGHIDERCPDLWRRYHLTLHPGPIVMPLKSSYKTAQERWCSGCAKSGHHENRCHFFIPNHPYVDPYIKEYRDVYGFPKSQPFLIHGNLTNSVQTEKQIPNKQNENLHTKHIETQHVDSNHLPKSDKIEENIKQNVNSINGNIQTNYQVTFENFSFPPTEMIPPYFRTQMELKKNLNTENKETGNISTRLISNLTSNSAVCSSSTTLSSNSTQTSPDKYTCTIVLNPKKLGFLQSTRGMNFISEIQRNSNITITINKDKEEDSPSGTVIVSGNIENVQETDGRLQRFLETSPNLENIPRYSRSASNFLSAKLDGIEKSGSNSTKLFIRLEKLQFEQFFGKESFQLKKKIKETKILLNTILFGKLKLGDGQKHMDILEYWRGKFQEKSNYKIPLNILYDLFDSYSYIFLDNVDHDYQSFCGRSKIYQRDMKSVYRYSQLIGAKCRKYNMHNTLKELNNLKNYLHKSNFSAKAFKEFMSFCYKFMNSFNSDCG